MSATESPTFIALPPRERGVNGLVTGNLFMFGGTALIILAGLFLYYGRGEAAHFLVGIGALGVGLIRGGWLRIYPSHATVQMEDDLIRCHNRVISRKKEVVIRRADIAHLELEAAKRNWKNWFPQGMRLSAEMTNGTRLLIAQDYPPNVLQQLAETLSQWIKSHDADQNRDVIPRRGEIVNVTAIAPISRDVLLQPEKSAIVTAGDGNLHTFKLRRRGPFHSKVFYLGFNLILLIAAGLLIWLLAWLLKTPRNARPDFALQLMVTAVLTTLILLSLLVLAFHYFKRQSVIVTGPMEEGELGVTCITQGPLRSSECSWKKSAIRSITTGEYRWGNSFQASDEKNRRFQVVIRTSQGKRRSVAEGTEMDMRWLATELRRILDLPNEYRK